MVPHACETVFAFLTPHCSTQVEFKSHLIQRLFKLCINVYHSRSTSSLINLIVELKPRNNINVLMHFSLESEDSSSDDDQCYRRRTWSKYRQEVLQEFGYDEIQDMDSD